jgi:hypothetical protein
MNRHELFVEAISLDPIHPSSPTSDLWDSGFTGLFAPCSCSLALSGPGKVLDEQHYSSCPALQRERLLRLSGRTTLYAAFRRSLAGRDSREYYDGSVPLLLAQGGVILHSHVFDVSSAF